MTIRNFLYPSPKKEPEVIFLEKKVYLKRSFFFEFSRVLIVLATVTAITWGITLAQTDEEITPTDTSDQATSTDSHTGGVLENIIDTISDIGTSIANTITNTFFTSEQVNKNFSAMGTVSEVSSKNISIENIKGYKDKSQTSITFNTNSVTKIQSKDFTPLSLQDIKVGDSIIIQGEEENGFSVNRIIYIPRSALLETATSTESIATSTASTTDTATSTESSVGIIDTIIDKVSDFVDSVIGSATSTVEDATSTSTDETSPATSTEGVVPDVEAPTTSSDVNTTDTTDNVTTEPVTPNIIESVVNAVSDTINNVSDFVTGNSEPTTPPDTSADSSVTPIEITE